MPFGRNARICLEHGGINQAQEHYETVTYWYGAPYATLVQTDELTIADEKSEQAHDYRSPDASEPYEITSRYELGPDQMPTRHAETYGLTTKFGRKTTGTSEFSLHVDPKSVGVMLRRTLDYWYPNQRAEVFVADQSSAAADAPLAWKKGRYLVSHRVEHRDVFQSRARASAELPRSDYVKSSFPGRRVLAAAGAD